MNVKEVDQRKLIKKTFVCLSVLCRYLLALIPCFSLADVHNCDLMASWK